MAESFFLSGHAANACVNAQSVVVSSEDVLFPKANLQNGRPWEPFRFGSVAANPTIDFDCNIIVNSSFETDADLTTPPTAWSIPTGGGTPDVSTVAVNEGTKSLRLNVASEAAFQDRDVRPGGTYRHTVALRGDGTNIVNAYVLDLISGKYWTGSAWTTTKTAWVTRSTATFAVSSTTVVLEEPVPGHIGPARIRILFDRPGTIAGAAYVDSVYMWPKVTVAALLYDTTPSGFTVSVQADDNAAFSSVTALGTMPAWRFRRYVTFAGPATPERYIRFLFTGTPFDLNRIWIGQPVLGERKVMTRHPNQEIIVDRTMPVAGTEDEPATLADAPRYTMELRWRNTAAGLAEAMDHMLAACRYGAEPLFIVPRDDRDTFVYGRGQSLNRISHRAVVESVYEYSLSVTDDQYPVFTK